MDIAVVGAGISGLSAAWWLRRAGHKVRIFERNYKPGGRMSSRRKAGLVVDHGDPFIYRDSPALRDLIIDCGLQGSIVPISRPIFSLHEDGSFREPAEQAIDSNRVTFREGMLALPEALRRQLGGYYSISVSSIDWDESDQRFVVQAEPPLRLADTQFGAIIVATPAPIAMEISRPLHHRLNGSFVERAMKVEYTRCFTLMAALENVDLPQSFYALRPPIVKGAAISWLAFEDLKCEGREVPGWSMMVVHATPEASDIFLKKHEANAIEDLYKQARKIVPQLPPQWRWARAKRWDMARLRNSETTPVISQYPAAPDKFLIEFCGDYREGDGCEPAASSGREAAQILLGKIEKMTAGS